MARADREYHVTVRRTYHATETVTIMASSKREAKQLIRKLDDGEILELGQPQGLFWDDIWPDAFIVDDVAEVYLEPGSPDADHQ
jgi:hypothetical protein